MCTGGCTYIVYTPDSNFAICNSVIIEISPHSERFATVPFEAAHQGVITYIRSSHLSAERVGDVISE